MAGAAFGNAGLCMVPLCLLSFTQNLDLSGWEEWRGSALQEAEAVGGAQDAGGAAVEDVGVDHGGGDVAVAEEFLDGADVGAVL